jgi:hypothetical protein
MPFYLMLASASETAWLNLTNAVLGVAVLLCFGLIAGAAVCECTARSRRRAHIMRHADEAVRALFHGRGRARD